MADRPFNVLFLCTGNSARSILAEAILNASGAGNSAPSAPAASPKGEVNPVRARAAAQVSTTTSPALRSKSWDEFAGPARRALDFVFTVCDNAAGEACPVWPGQPMTAHWGIPDPAAATGSEAEIALAFKDAYRMLNRRIELFLALPIQKLDRLVLTTRLKEIGP